MQRMTELVEDTFPRRPMTPARRLTGRAFDEVGIVRRSERRFLFAAKRVVIER